MSLTLEDLQETIEEALSDFGVEADKIKFFKNKEGVLCIFTNLTEDSQGNLHSKDDEEEEYDEEEEDVDFDDVDESDEDLD